MLSKTSSAHSATILVSQPYFLMVKPGSYTTITALVAIDKTSSTE
ncbi:hypothetical protein SLEP1_g53006 [Rubroshorea leprosula]|uniref:Uncharacterized protein n=1 Tax=Rubroshorea leprosula TaxID=152421 RepID=A0AAV5M816_9ROSI|nr:hypothetical protein SLEP1_g53006 [Rubroshorea leprosula]